jgi:glucose/arabinose dehydrogenase
MKKIKLPLLVFFALSMLFVSLSFVKINQQGELPGSAGAHYLQYCASCHGENFERFAARQWVYGNSVQDVVSTLKYGRPAIGMPEFGKAMSDSEINALAQYTIENVARVPAIIPSIFNINDTVRSLDLDFVLEEVAGGNMKIPWGMAFLPNGDMLVTEKSGVLYLVSGGKMMVVDGLPELFVRGQGGLMEVAVHPQFEKNSLIYIAYADGDASNALNTSIGRGELRNGRLVNFERIMRGIPGTNAGVHFGCRIVFDKDGYLYFTIGDRGRKENAQDLSNHCGKVHRIFDDGRIPTDNPFMDVPNAVKSIWSYGHRNPQGLVYDRNTNLIWSNEHGPKGGDELNIVMKGKNYGWPEVTFGINYDGTIITNDTARVDVEPPVYYWIPSIGPSSLAKVSGSRYPGWENDFLSGSLSFEYLERTIMKNNRVIATEKLLHKIGRVRNVVQAPDGYLYIAVENPGKVYKIVPVN